jgi:hypothetical protein
MKNGSFKTARCKYCGKFFKPRNRAQKYDSKKCAIAARIKQSWEDKGLSPIFECPICGREVRRTSITTMTCGRMKCRQIYHTAQRARKLMKSTKNYKGWPVCLYKSTQTRFDRDYWCKNYNKCLDIAINQNWPGFTCITELRGKVLP